MIDLLKKLCEIPGISGREDAVREYIKNEALPYASEIKEDVMGNLFVFKKGKKPRKEPLMVSAHMDEVGLMVTAITEDGYLKFDFAGSVDKRVIIGKRVLVGEKKINGIIGLRAIHLTTKEERKKTPKLKELCIDIGCEKKSETSKLVSLGDYVVFDSPYRSLGENKIKANALDDRFGCAVMLSLIKEEAEYDTWYAFTVQEEVGCRGAECAAYSIKPGVALVLESTTAADIPSADGANRVCTLGAGPVIGYMDRSTIYNKPLFALLRDIAIDNGIKWQIKSRVAGGTDASKINVSRGGVRTTSLSLPTRYIHSPSCVGDKRDMESILKLARLFVNCEEERINA